MTTARPIEHDNEHGYTASPKWWAAIPDSITVTVEQIEATFYDMGLEHIDVQSFVASATGQPCPPREPE